MRERRTFPRHPVTFPVSIALNSKGQSLLFKTEAVDISRSSIQISCDSQPIEALLAQEEYPHEARLDFRIPGSDNWYSIHSQVVTHRRLAQNHYYLVLIYNEFNAGSEAELEEELRELEPDSLQADAL